MTRLLIRLSTVAILATASCSPMIALMGKDVARYQRNPGDFTREQVISHLGMPSLSTPVSPARRAADLESASFAACAPFMPHSGGSLVALVDEHELKAPIRTREDEFAAGAAWGYAGYTLGLSELYLAPSFLAIRLQEEDRSFYAFYDRSGRLVATALSPLSGRKGASETR